MKFATGGTNLIKLYKSRVEHSQNDAITLSITTLSITIEIYVKHNDIMRNNKPVLLLMSLC
jgi:hypothetical protein